MVVVKRTEFCGFCFQLCGEHLNFLVNDVFKHVFGDTLILFEASEWFWRCQQRVFACFHPNLFHRFGVRLV